MKLQRFIAASNQKVMEKIQKTLGLDALIYSTRTVPGGVEMLACHPNELPLTEEVNGKPCFFHDDTEVTLEKIDLSTLNQLQEKLNNIDVYLKNLSKQFNSSSLYETHLCDDEKLIKKNWLYFHLNRLGFRGKFCQQFSNQYFRSKKSDNLTEISINQALLKNIYVTPTEIIHEKPICALMGPTGIGKTTTIVKIAKRYIKHYGNQSLGFITTDYNDIVSKNQLYYYSRLFNVDLEYVSDERDLGLALKKFQNKQFILIDTHGVSQRDSAQVEALLALLESQGNRISTYIALPCNVQEPILDEIARAFSTINLQGSILTKQDEAISIAPALSVSMHYKMPIAYVCHGQDIEADISLADPKALLHQILDESNDHKSLTEEILFKNMKRVANYAQR